MQDIEQDKAASVVVGGAECSGDGHVEDVTVEGDDQENLVLGLKMGMVSVVWKYLCFKSLDVSQTMVFCNFC